MWAVWRQNRRSLIATLTLIVLLTAVTVAAAVVVEQNDSTWTFGQICSRWNDVGQCRPETALTLTTLFALLLPLALGLFVGVTAFSRDIEQRTHVLGMTQSVSRLRWYFARVVVVFVPTTAAMVCLGLSLRWAATAGGNARAFAEDGAMTGIAFSLYDFPYFETTGIAIGGYTLLAMLVGGTAAIFLRSTVGAMVTTVVVFLFVPVALTLIVREDYGDPQIEVEPISGYARATEYAPNPYFTTDGTWVVAAGYVDSDGTRVSPDESRCAPVAEPDDRARRPDETDDEYTERRQIRQEATYATYDTCLRNQGVDRYEIAFHTEDDYWRFQVTETGLTLLLSGTASLAGMWGIRRLGA